MKTKHDTHTARPYPRNRLLMIDGGQLGRRKHTVHGLVEFDVTQARATIRDHKLQTGESLSFSAFVVACLGKAIDSDTSMHAYRNWRNQVICFDEVDVNMLFEVEVNGITMIRPHILRGVNKRSMHAIHEEIRGVQNAHTTSPESTLIDWFVRLPAWARRVCLGIMFQHPQIIKDYYGTVLITSVGMFGTGSGWGIPVPNHSLQLTLGGISAKPAVVDQHIEVRQYLSVTISVDHDLIDGAPAARFAQRLKELIERGYGLCDVPAD